MTSRTGSWVDRHALSDVPLPVVAPLTARAVHLARAILRDIGTRAQFELSHIGALGRLRPSASHAR